MNLDIQLLMLCDIQYYFLDSGFFVLGISSFFSLSICYHHHHYQQLLYMIQNGHRCCSIFLLVIKNFLSKENNNQNTKLRFSKQTKYKESINTVTIQFGTLLFHKSSDATNQQFYHQNEKINKYYRIEQKTIGKTEFSRENFCCCCFSVIQVSTNTHTHIVIRGFESLNTIV